MKCSACANDDCYGDYDFRYRCTGKKEGVECSCCCQASTAEAVAATISSVAIGAAATAGKFFCSFSCFNFFNLLHSGGIALTVMTGGLFAIIAGGAIASAGSSLIFSPIQKKLAGECMTVEDTLKDFALGATIGKNSKI